MEEWAGSIPPPTSLWPRACAGVRIDAPLDSQTKCRQAACHQRRQLADKRLLPSCRAGMPTRSIAVVTQTQYTLPMKSAVIPQIRVEPELRAELESVLRQGETLTDFVEATVRDAIAFRRVQTAFHARAQAASEEYHRTGVSVPVDTVLQRLQSKLDAKRKKLGR